MEGVEHLLILASENDKGDSTPLIFTWVTFNLSCSATLFIIEFLLQTLYTLERLQEITSQEVETPHEHWFQENYGKLITMAMDRLRNPTNPNHPSSSWQPFKQVPCVFWSPAFVNGDLNTIYVMYWQRSMVFFHDKNFLCQEFFNKFPFYFQLHSSLQQRAQKRSSLILKMDRISPKLQSLKSTVIAMPGLGMSGKVTQSTFTYIGQTVIFTC